MKITKRQLRRIIREELDRGFGWVDFQGMAQAGDYEGAGQWLQDLARDRGLTIDREVEDMMIEMGADEYTTDENLESEWEEIMDQLSGASARARPWEHN